jgi:hypothetical protein
MFRNEIRTEATIAGTADEVWNVLVDFAHYGEWNPAMRSVQGKAAVGERLTIAFERSPGKTMTLRPTVLAADTGHEFRWMGRLLLPGIFDGEHLFELHEDEPGTVRFVQSERFSGVLVPFLRKMIEVETLDQFHRVNDALATRVGALRNAGAV